MDAVTVFNFNQSQVRTVIRGGEPWFVAKDVCDILELEKIDSAIRDLGDDEKGYSQYEYPWRKSANVRRF